jgi:predicted phage tail protein
MADPTPASPGDIELRKSRLAVVGRELQKLDEDGVVVARHALDQLRQAGVTHRVDWAAVLLALVFAGGAAACWFYLTATGWRIGWAVLLGGVAAVLTAVAREHELVLQFDQGVVRYAIKDKPDEAAGFAVSLQERARG